LCVVGRDRWEGLIGGLSEHGARSGCWRSHNLFFLAEYGGMTEYGECDWWRSSVVAVAGGIMGNSINLVYRHWLGSSRLFPSEAFSSVVPHSQHRAKMAGSRMRLRRQLPYAAEKCYMRPLFTLSTRHRCRSNWTIRDSPRRQQIRRSPSLHCRPHLPRSSFG